MTVTRIGPHPKRRSYYDIEFDRHESVLVHEDVIVELGLRAGTLLTPEALDRIAHEQQVAEAREAALGLLRTRGRSLSELQIRLQKKGFGRDVVDAGVAKLEDLGLVDDVRFAHELARSLVRREYGRVGLLYKLRAGGVTAEVAEAVVGEMLEGVDEAERAAQALQRRQTRWQGLGVRERRGKAHQYLARLGYEADTIIDALNAVLADE